MMMKYFIPLLLTGSAFAQFPTPVLETLYPPGGQANSTVEVTLAGQNLEDLRGMLFSHPNLKAELITEPHPLNLPPLPLAGRLRVVIGDVPSGTYSAQVFTAQGLSNARLFDVSTLKEVAKTANSLEKPQAIEMDSVITGRFDARKIDVYAFEAKKDQTVVLNLMAERIDSRADATLKILDTSGRQLASARDTLYRDPVIYFKVPADGSYLAAVHDFSFTGGAQHVYRLNVSTRATIRSIHPPAIQPGEKRLVTLFGANLPGEEARVEIQAPPASQDLPLYQKLTEHNTPGFAYRYKDAEPFRIPFASAPITLAKEQNEPIPLGDFPTESAGQFDTPGDIDDFSFAMKKDDTLLVEVISHRMNQPTDPHLRVYKTIEKNGQMERQFITEQDDTDPKVGGKKYSTAHRDPVYTLKADADATYIVSVGNRYLTRGPDAAYRFVLRRPQPDFALIATYAAPLADANKVSLAGPSIVRDDNTVFEIFALRKEGFEGEIHVEVQGLSDGYTAYPCTITPNSTSGLLVIAAKADAAPWSGDLRIIGKARLDNHELQHDALAVSSTWTVDNLNEIYHQQRLQPRLSLGLNEYGQSALTIKAADGQVWETCIGAKFELAVKYETTHEIKNNVAIKGLGLPHIKNPPNMNIDKDKTEGKLTWDLTQNNSPGLKPGSYQIVLRGDGTFSYTPDPQLKIEADDRKTRTEAGHKEAEAAYKTAQQASSDAKKQLDQTRQQIQTEKKEGDEAKNLLAGAEDKLKQAQQLEQEQKARMDQLKPLLDAAVNLAKKAAEKTKPRDMKFACFSAPMTLQIAASPLTTSPERTELTLKPEGKMELLVKLDRKYGFAEKVELNLLPPNGLQGLKITNLAVKNEEAEGRILLEASKEIPPGSYPCELQAKYAFNNHPFDEKQAITLVVEAPQEVVTP